LGCSDKTLSLPAAGWNPFVTAGACGFPQAPTADSASSNSRRGRMQQPPPGLQQHRQQEHQGQQGQHGEQAVPDSNSMLVSVGKGGAATSSSSDGRGGGSGRRFAALLRRFRAAGRGASTSSSPAQGHASLPLPLGAACSEDGSRCSPYLLSVCESTSQTESVSPRKLTSPGDRSGVAWMSALAGPAPWFSREAQL
jgi:hypothetical protein